MAKLTKAQVAAIGHTLTQLERVQAFIASDRTAVCRVSDTATTTLHYTRVPYIPAIDRSPDDAKPLLRMAKTIGSDLCLLPDAIASLKRLLEN